MDISIFFFCNKFQVYFNDQILYCPIKLDHLRCNLRGLKSMLLEDIWGSEALKEAVIDGEREPLGLEDFEGHTVTHSAGGQ